MFSCPLSKIIWNYHLIHGSNFSVPHLIFTKYHVWCKRESWTMKGFGFLLYLLLNFTPPMWYPFLVPNHHQFSPLSRWHELMTTLITAVNEDSRPSPKRNVSLPPTPGFTEGLIFCCHCWASLFFPAPFLLSLVTCFETLKSLWTHLQLRDICLWFVSPKPIWSAVGIPHLHSYCAPKGQLSHWSILSQNNVTRSFH